MEHEDVKTNIQPELCPTTILYGNGNVKYHGQMDGDKYDGEGKVYYENGKLKYEGEFVDGKIDGYGKYYDEQGNLWYEGEYKNNKRHGSGKEYYSDLASGQIGTKSNSTSSRVKYQGEFENDKFLFGKYFVYNVDGSITTYTYSNENITQEIDNVYIMALEDKLKWLAEKIDELESDGKL